MNSTMWKIALRTLARDKTYALINVAGLAIAIACCLLLGEYLHSELTYDQSHENYKRIFRIANEFEINGKRDSFARTSPVLGPMLKEENADVEAYVRFLGGGAQPELPPARQRRLLLARHLRRRYERVRRVHAQDPLRRPEARARLADVRSRSATRSRGTTSASAIRSARR